MIEFRPISLSNVLYRIFSNLLTNHLKIVMRKLILEHQSAFMFDQLISNNSLMAFETLHFLRNHNKGKTGFMALNLDMSKAYDMVEWSYMEKVHFSKMAPLAKCFILDQYLIKFLDMRRFFFHTIRRITYNVVHLITSLEKRFSLLYEKRIYPNCFPNIGPK